MDCMFGGNIGKFVVCYLDNFLVYSQTLEEHLDHLKVIVDIL